MYFLAMACLWFIVEAFRYDWLRQKFFADMELGDTVYFRGKCWIVDKIDLKRGVLELSNLHEIGVRAQTMFVSASERDKFLVEELILKLKA